MLRVQMAVPWLFAVCLVILTAAALLHWQRTRHWCLLTLATGSLLVALGITAMQIALRQQVLPSGTIRINTSLLWIGVRSEAAGVVVLAVGGVGAILWAMRLRQRPEQPPAPPAC
jgi:hypothetical protein